MFGAMTSLTGSGGGGSVSGGDSSTGDQKASSVNTTEAGNLSFGGINIGARGFKFDASNPAHLVGGAIAAFLVVAVSLKMLKK